MKKTILITAAIAICTFSYGQWAAKSALVSTAGLEIISNSMPVFAGETGIEQANDVMPLLDGTKWRVAIMDANGKIVKFSATPWVFQGKGKVSAAGHWTAVYYKTSPNTCHVVMDNGSRYSLILITEDRFICVQDGVIFRYGEKL